MTYVGRGVDAISNVEKLDNITFDGSTTYNLTKSSVAFTPAGKNNILVSINGVIQQGNFTVAGATIVFDFSPTSNDTCNFIMHYGTGVLNTPADSSVNMAQLGASGTKSSSTFLAGDNSFKTISTFEPDGAVVFNESSADVDFRVESNGNANMLVVNGGGNRVGVGADPDMGVGLHIKSGDCGAGGPNAGGDELVVEGSGDTGISIMSGTSNNCTIFFGDSGNDGIGKIDYDHNDNSISFTTNASTRASIDSSGVFKVNSRMFVDGQIDSNAKINVMFGGDNENGMQFSDKDGATNGKFLGFSRDGTSTSSQGTQIGTITRNSSSDAVSYNTSSDYRLKDGIVNKTDGIEKLKQLQPRKFYWKSDSDKTLVDGFLAHEVSSIVPESISGEKDAMAVETRYTAEDSETQGESPSKKIGNPKTYSSTKIDPQGIDQSKLVPLLTAALKESIAKIEALETRVKTLEDA